ncbi:MAG TPA: MFS transporter [Bacteroidales bacterium]|nr:MFS transporter [Bacteroidales bacterium]
MNKTFKTVQVVSISFAHFLHDLYAAFLAPVLPVIIQKLNISYTSASLLSVAQNLPTILNPFLGLAADKPGMRIFVVIAPVLTATAMSLIGLSPNYTILLLLMLVTGISSALFHLPSPVMIHEFSGTKIGLGMSFYAAAGELARTAGPFVIVAAISLWGFEGTWRLIPFSVVLSLYLFFLFNTKNILKGKIQPTINTTGVLEELNNHKTFFLTMLGFLFFNAAIRASLSTFLPTYLHEQGKSLVFGGSAIAVYQLAGAGGSLVVGALSDYIGRKRMLFAIGILSPVFMQLFLFFSDSMLGFVFLTATGFVILSSGSILLVLTQELNSKRKAFVNGIYMTINFVSTALMLPIIGFISDFSGLKSVYNYSVYAGVIAVFFIIFIPTNKLDKK